MYEMLSPASAHGKCLVSDLLCLAIYLIFVCGYVSVLISGTQNWN